MYHKLSLGADMEIQVDYEGEPYFTVICNLHKFDYSDAFEFFFQGVTNISAQ